MKNKSEALTDDQAMSLAIAEARHGWGWVSPNPAVGCVILSSVGQMISKGYHEKYGGPHAEINALRGLSQAELHGARVFVTLEPCAHYGKTPPCAEALAKLPISEVVYGLQDPNPQVQGKGLEILKSAGIKVTHFKKYEKDCARICEHFLKNMNLQRPFVTLKAAVSLDGKLALKNGQSQWITGEASRLEAHRLRAFHEAVLVGVNTFLTDDPSLNIRHPDFPQKSTQVIVLDPTGRGLSKLKDSKLYANHSPSSIYWVVSQSHKESQSLVGQSHDKSQSGLDQSLDELKINIIYISPLDKQVDSNLKGKHVADGFPTKSSEANLGANNNLDPGEGKLISATELNLNELLSELWKRSIRAVLVEGGASTLSAFVNQRVADRLSLFIAPMIIGDRSGRGWAQELQPIENLSQSLKTGDFEISQLGNDLWLSTALRF